MEPNVISVMELNQILLRKIQTSDVANLRVSGQINGMSTSGGHIYLTLKDEAASIRGIIWRSTAARMQKLPANGDQVVVTGGIQFYDKQGTVSLIISKIEPVGMGQLWKLFLAIRDALQREGLFSMERKRPLPPYPRKVAVVTSPTGEVLHDICRVAEHRNPSIPIVLVPVPVQGRDAVPSLVEGIREAATIPGVDVMILARGGGSMEDLWCFNDERVARAVAASPIPVVTGVGHEPDTTIVDFVADRRASTPSHAAEIVFPDRIRMVQTLQALQNRIIRTMENTFSGLEKRILLTKNRLAGRSPEHVLGDLMRQAVQTAGRLERAMDNLLIRLQFTLSEQEQKIDILMDRCLNQTEEALRALRLRLEAPLPEIHLAEMEKAVQVLRIRMETSAEKTLEKNTNRYDACALRLRGLDPRKILVRGYAFVTAGDRVVSRASEAPCRMMLHFQDGQIQVTQTDKEAAEHEQSDL